MKTEVRIIVSSRDSGSEAVDELASLYPNCVERGKFTCSLALGDPRVSEIMERLAARGLKPYGRKKGSTDYRLDVLRTYSRHDFRESPYLLFVAKARFFGVTRAADGVIEVQSREIRPGADFASALSPWLLVSEKVKGLLEGQGMQHLVFREARILGPAGKPSTRSKGCFWELTTDLILPPMGPPCKFVHSITEEEVAADCTDPFIMREGLEVPEYCYFPPEVHYDAGALRKVGPFDIARTFERMVGGDTGGRLVCSQQFYRLCEEKRLDQKLVWFPVRINPD